MQEDVIGSTGSTGRRGGQRRCGSDKRLHSALLSRAHCASSRLAVQKAARLNSGLPPAEQSADRPWPSEPCAAGAGGSTARTSRRAARRRSWWMRAPTLAPGCDAWPAPTWATGARSPCMLGLYRSRVAERAGDSEVARARRSLWVHLLNFWSPGMFMPPVCGANLLLTGNVSAAWARHEGRRHLSFDPQVLQV